MKTIIWTQILALLDEAWHFRTAEAAAMADREWRRLMLDRHIRGVIDPEPEFDLCLAASDALWHAERNNNSLGSFTRARKAVVACVEYAAAVA